MSDVQQAAEAARAAGKNIGGDGVRELGVVPLATPESTALRVDPALSQLAVDVLRDEMSRMLAARAEFAGEQSHGAPARGSARLDAMAASLEGATRLALRLGLITPGDAREVWTQARAAGVRDDAAVRAGRSDPMTAPTEGT